MIERVKLPPKKKKKLGRPATGQDPMVAIRIPVELTARIDAWAKANGETRSAGMRRLMVLGLQAPQGKRRGR